MKLFIGLLLVVFSVSLGNINSGASAMDADGYTNLPFYYDYIKSHVDKGLKNKTTQEVLDYIKTNVKGDHQVYAYMALFSNLKREKKLDQPEVVNLAFDLKEATAGPNVTSQALRSSEQMNRFLPRSVRNLMTAKCIMIRRNGGKEDLYVPADQYKKDKNRRPVFTWIPGQSSNKEQSCWTVTREKKVKDQAFLIQSMEKKEYMYAAYDQYNIDKERRSVFTWVPGSHDKQSRWIFEPDGVNVHIKNVLFGEYLTTDNDKKHDENRRTVYTDVSKQKTKKSLWKIMDGDVKKRGR